MKATKFVLYGLHVVSVAVLLVMAVLMGHMGDRINFHNKALADQETRVYNIERKLADAEAAYKSVVFVVSENRLALVEDRKVLGVHNSRLFQLRDEIVSLDNTVYETFMDHKRAIEFLQQHHEIPFSIDDVPEGPR